MMGPAAQAWNDKIDEIQRDRNVDRGKAARIAAQRYPELMQACVDEANPQQQEQQTR